MHAVKSDMLPPGPSSRLLATMRFARDPFGTFEACRRRYGDPFTLPLLGSQVVVTGRPDLVREVFGMAPKKVGGLLGHLIPEILGQRSVLVMSGTEHAQQRKLMMPMFRGHRAIARMIGDVTRNEIRRHRPGAQITAYQLGRAISLDVILRTLFGSEDEVLIAKFRRATLRLADAGHPALIFARALRRSFGGLGPWGRVERRLAELDALFFATIGERRGQTPVDDMLGLLLAAHYEDGRPLNDQEIRDQLMSLVLAGHETMAVTMAWAMHWVGSQPEVRQRLDEELAASSDGQPLPYLDAVCKETLRIYPIQPVVMRHLLEPVEFAGHRLPAGTFVGAATTLVHMDPALFPSPEQFRPERFLAYKHPPTEFFPFGGGARRCIGADMAMHELKIVLATVLREFRLRCVDHDTPTPARQSTVTGPRGGVPLIYEGMRGAYV